MKTNRKWQARFQNWIGGTQYGVLCCGVRRRGRGPWLRPIDAPEEVREYLSLKQTPGAGRWYCEYFKNLATMQADAHVESKTLGKDGLRVMFTVEEKRDERPIPCHGMIRQLARELDVDSLYGIYRRTYKASTCGVSVGFLVCKDGGAEWVYCDSLGVGYSHSDRIANLQAGRKPLGTISEMLANGYEVNACAVTGYVEGCDAECETIILQSSLARRATAGDFWKAVEAADEEAEGIWNETHGCDDCGTPGIYGGNAINPNCKTCNGEGAIL